MMAVHQLLEAGVPPSQLLRPRCSYLQEQRGCRLRGYKGLSKGPLVSHLGTEALSVWQERSPALSAGDLEGASHEPPEFENILVETVRQGQDLPTLTLEVRPLLR
jgi:hypothetical protein